MKRFGRRRSVREAVLVDILKKRAVCHKWIELLKSCERALLLFSDPEGTGALRSLRVERISLGTMIGWPLFSLLHLASQFPCYYGM